MPQSVKRVTVGFGSGHDLMVHGFEPHVELTVQSLLGILSFFLSFCSSPAHVLSLSLSHSLKKQKNKTKQKNKETS